MFSKQILNFPPNNMQVNRANRSWHVDSIQMDAWRKNNEENHRPFHSTHRFVHFYGVITIYIKNMRIN